MTNVVKVCLPSKPISQVKSRPINWLYRGYLPLGMLVTLFAPKGRGKTKVADYFTAVITSGRYWDDGTPNTMGPKRVLRFNLEDPAAEVLKPGLFAVGANLENVEYPEAQVVVEKPDGKSVRQAIDLSKPDHIEGLKQKILEYPDVVLVIIEPVTNYRGIANTNSDDDMRPIYMELARIAAETGVCILAINHTNRRQAVDPLEKSLGAGSGPNVARMNFYLDIDPETKERMLTNAGSNLPAGETLCFKIESHPPFELDGHTLEEIGYAKFSRKADISADELMGRIEASKTSPDRGQRTAIKNAIRAALAHGEQAAGEIFATLKKSENGGFNERSIRRYAHEMETDGELVKESGGFGVVYWSLARANS